MNTLTSSRVLSDIKLRLNAGVSGFIDRMAMKIDSSQEVENYAWLGQVPKMREWVGGRQPKGLRENTWQITNKDYEATLEILTKDMRREKYGQISMRIAELSRRVLTFPESLMTTLIVAGEAAACYDGQYFFDTDHSEGSSGTQNNDITHAAATGTTPTVPEMRDAILEGIQAILGFKDDQGEPMNQDARVFEVMVPTAMWATATAAVTLPVVDSGVANLIPSLGQFKITVAVNPRLTNADRFYVFRTDAETKPFILQEELPITVDAVAEGSQLEFTDRKHWYGVQWAGAIGYGFWHHACLVTFT